MSQDDSIHQSLAHLRNNLTPSLLARTVNRYASLIEARLGEGHPALTYESEIGFPKSNGWNLLCNLRFNLGFLRRRYIMLVEIGFQLIPEVFPISAILPHCAQKPVVHSPGSTTSTVTLLNRAIKCYTAPPLALSPYNIHRFT